jgi:hypothetical protein
MAAMYGRNGKPGADEIDQGNYFDEVNQRGNALDYGARKLEAINNGTVGEFYKEQMQNLKREGDYYVVEIEGVKYKFNIYNFDGPAYHNSDNTNIIEAIDNLSANSAEFLIDKTRGMNLDTVEINSLWRGAGNPHNAGRGIDIGSVSRDGVTVYFNNSTVGTQSDAAMALRQDVFTGFRNDDRVGQVFDPWRIYKSANNIDRMNQWMTIPNMDNGIDYQHRHHLHITIKP